MKPTALASVIGAASAVSLLAEYKAIDFYTRAFNAVVFVKEHPQVRK